MKVRSVVAVRILMSILRARLSKLLIPIAVGGRRLADDWHLARDSVVKTVKRLRIIKPPSNLLFQCDLYNDDANT